ncbi:LacI family DNA-binding transcriptional regulator [Halomonas aestuarii]|uniref:LacI family DNA-binding transcriptional regulator n=1 Tax=Halomonas aestuarii TaxID=1897729 RepID=UPI000AC86320|nr:LacI family DNA-binding transcriptional regulator [Halomonas aestuarii]
MTPPRRITLKDLARELGVSTASVSNAFNRPDQLSPKLRERILSEARRLGYSGPDAMARSLRTGRSRIIAVILAESLTYSLNDAVSSELLSGIAEVLDTRGHTLLLLSGRQSSASVPGASSIADGFIIYGLMPSIRLLSDLPPSAPWWPWTSASRAMPRCTSTTSRRASPSPAMPSRRRRDAPR